MGRSYNIPRHYLVDKGLPIEFLSQKIKNEKCKEIFENQVKEIVWKYQIVNDDVLNMPGNLTGKKGFTVFEVHLREETDAELMTEIISTAIPRRMVLVFFADEKIAITSYIPDEYGLPPRLQTTNFYETDPYQVIEILGNEDRGKDYQSIQRRLSKAIREKKKELLIDQAFEKIQKNKKSYLDDFDILFSEANLDKIREDAEFVEEQLKVLF